MKQAFFRQDYTCIIREGREGDSVYERKIRREKEREEKRQERETYVNKERWKEDTPLTRQDKI